jgi:ubiquinone/menaquinone biosynthesis C-methylase UbiE
MDKPRSSLDFRFMVLTYKVRDLLRPRREILGEVGIQEGFRVLDYGCGPGGYVAATAELVGPAGHVYALDIHPLAVQMVRELVSKKHLANVETILSDCDTGLPDESIDVVLLYDIFHDLGDSPGVLDELHRVLKPSGVLSFSDHHMREKEIVAELTRRGLFRLSEKGQKTYSFSKQAP